MTVVNPMRKLAVTLALVALAAPAAASAQAHVSVRIGLPAVLPPLVVVEPGVQVVQDLDEEIFFVDGNYWARRDGWWYRAHDHRARWTHVEPRWVPAALVRTPPGHYRHWRGEYRHPSWRPEHRHAGWYHDRARRHWRQEQRHHPRHEVQEHRRDGRWEHGRGEKREWREARWEPQRDHRRGHGRH